jgi:hypothetical protein
MSRFSVSRSWAAPDGPTGRATRLPLCARSGARLPGAVARPQKKEAPEEESKKGRDRHGVTGAKGSRIFEQGNCKVGADDTATEIMGCRPISLWKYPGGGHRGRLASPLVTRRVVRSMFPNARAMSPKEVAPEHG